MYVGYYELYSMVGISIPVGVEDKLFIADILDENLLPIRLFKFYISSNFDGPNCMVIMSRVL
jgi:hypothetical protein